MGSCSSQEPPSPAHGSRKLTSCDTRTDRSSNFADARSSQPSTSAAVMVPVINAASTKSSSVGQSYARFDRAHATKSQQRYFEAFSRSKASSSRRATLANLAAIKEGDVLALSDADVNSILFAHVGEGIHELDDIFRSAQTGETTHPPGEVASADAPTLTELNSEGILRLGALLSDSPQDETTLLFLYLLGCREGPWLLKFETWQVGCAALCIVNRSTAVKAYANCVDLYGKMRLSDTQFFEFYKFLFDFVKPPSVRSLSVDDAVTLWEAVLVPRWAGGAAWCAFIKDHPMAKRGIFKDLWSQIVVFATLMTWPSCPEADMDTAWPSLIDSFVDECRHPKKRDSKDADAATTTTV